VSEARRVEVGVFPPYTVHVGPGALHDLPALLSELVPLPTAVAIISDETVAPLHAAALGEVLARLRRPVSLHVVTSGEGAKSLPEYGRVLTALAEARVDRGGLVVALGGGVVGDLAGFVAATYLRGLPFLQVPTTLLAMVDSSVGGKTGVNLPHGKNLVGAFWQPLAVVADTSLLSTLPDKALRQGAVELYKAGLLGDPAIVAAFGDHRGFGSVVDERGPALADLVARAVAVEASVVAEDPLERGRRAILNLGHTVGHALESLSRHALSHAEAVAYGLLAAAAIGARRGLVDWRPLAHELLTWVAPGPLPAADVGTLLEAMHADKKRVGSVRRFVLLEAVGHAVVVDDVADDELAAAWDVLQEVGR
jgi:3-dehydroquinate synthase